jgi:pimeloyl-ACP methyl ester carboxylesterase
LKNKKWGVVMKRFLHVWLFLVFSVAATHAEERWQTLPEPPAMPRAKETGYAPVNGIQMYYATFGEGEPILLIHGGLGHADVWANQVIELSKTHKVIVADSRGHGRSTRNADPYGYDLMASDYLALLDFLKIDKAALVGWSDGGIIGIDIAMTHPERLTKLFAQAANVTVDGVDPGVMTNKTFGAYIERSGKDYLRLSKTPNEYDAFVKQISHMWESQPAWTKEQLGKIMTPTIIVLGDHDEAVTRKHTEYMASVIPGAKLLILENASHFAMLQDPAGYTKAVLDFVDAK